MKAIVATSPGGPEVLELREVPDPLPGPGEVRIRMRSVGLNGADLLQRRGLYPPPPGASELLGLEVAGEIDAVGTGVSGWKAGDRAMALLAGGGYAERVVVPAELAMPVPAAIPLEDAGGVPEVFLTAYLELAMLGRLQAGETLLIHAGASGVGTAAIQVGRELGARVLVTAGSDAKLARCREFGADVGINYKTESFAARVKEVTAGRGVDSILDLVGAVHWAGNVEALAIGGRLLLVGLGGGAKASVDLRALLSKRITVIGSTLRARPLADKAELTRRFGEFSRDRWTSGALRPVIDRHYPFAQAAEAHRYLETQANVGKVVLVAARDSLI